MAQSLPLTDEYDAGLLDSLPEEWDKTTIGAVTDLSRKSRGLSLSDYEEVPFVPMDVIPDSGVFIKDYYMKLPQDISSGSYCDRGDILLAKITPSFENGKQGILDDIPLDFAYATTEVFPLKPHPDRLDRMFLFHFLRLSQVRTDMAAQMEGSTGRQRIPKKVLDNYPICLPPLAEQRRIAAVLTTLQEAIASQEDVIAAARAFKRSLMHRLFTYGPAPVPAETKETEIGEIPAHWEVKPLHDVAEFVTKPRSLRIAAFRSIPFIPMDYIPDSNMTVRGWIAKDSEDISTGTYCERGNLLVAKITPSFENGKQAILGDELPLHFAYATTEVYAIRGKPGGLAEQFMFYYLKQENIRRELAEKMEGTTGRQRLPKSVMANSFLPVPPSDEQSEIVHVLITLDARIAAEEDRKTALEALFKSMLHQLMTGRLRLRSDDGLPLSS